MSAAIKTLVIAPNWIGDALMAQPLLTLLKRQQPKQNITVLAPSWVAPVLAAMPEVDAVRPTALAHGSLQWHDRRTFARQLRAEQFDRAYVLPNSFKAALIPWLAGIPQRIGYVGEMRYGLLNQRLPNPPAELAMVRRYAALAQTRPMPDELSVPRLQVAPESSALALKQFGLSAVRPLIALCPGAEFGPAKRWPAAHFAELAIQILQRDATAQIILLGGPGDHAIAEEIRTTAAASDCSSITNLAGKTQLSEALALIAVCDHVVSNDSGLMHVAAALQRPQTALFGSSDPRHTPPLSSRARIIWLHLSCSPCFQRICPLGHLNCLNGIEPRAVMEKLLTAPPLFHHRSDKPA